MSAIELSGERARQDAGAIHAFLTRSYWAQGISRARVERSLEASLCFGLFDAGAQVGFARVVTDRTTFAYLCDVYVLETHRGRGLGKRLLAAVVSHPDLAELRRFVLWTRDAHGLYEQFGFSRLTDQPGLMGVVKPFGFHSQGETP
ncbi:MAG TPA: GNAT family N-acetyltransferase [Myxococcota bacterium]|nr:GNAT family N-acetyltransferase [Myxococcota bacterium]